MAFTSHGHHIPGTFLDDTDDNQRDVAPCGGISHCTQCRTEADQIMVSDKMRETSYTEFSVRDDESSIFYKGRYYYLSCGRDVKKSADSRSYCILPSGHLATFHIDGDGNTRDAMGLILFDANIRAQARDVLLRTGLDTEEVYNALNALQVSGFTLTKENRDR